MSVLIYFTQDLPVKMFFAKLVATTVSLVGWRICGLLTNDDNTFIKVQEYAAAIE